MSMYKCSEEKTKTQKQTNVSSVLFFLYIVFSFFISIIAPGRIETGYVTNMQFKNK